MMNLQFLLAQLIKTDARNQLALALRLERIWLMLEYVIMIILRCMRYGGYSVTVQKEVSKYFESEGCCIIQDDYRPLSCEDIVFGSAMIGQSLFLS